MGTINDKETPYYQIAIKKARKKYIPNPDLETNLDISILSNSGFLPTQE
ncbi:MAG: hypothetical protein M1412_08770 [Deltaproteobacteria bacterium]|nr:hypothetical protein [Deltaproteobacteria bacterium]MCL5893234.1 hypothetical protein [Deltaproteobacteria bacterium]